MTLADLGSFFSFFRAALFPYSLKSSFIFLEWFAVNLMVEVAVLAVVDFNDFQWLVHVIWEWRILHINFEELLMFECIWRQINQSFETWYLLCTFLSTTNLYHFLSSQNIKPTQSFKAFCGHLTPHISFHSLYDKKVNKNKIIDFAKFGHMM